MLAMRAQHHWPLNHSNHSAPVGDWFRVPSAVLMLLLVSAVQIAQHPQSTAYNRCCNLKPPCCRQGMPEDLIEVSPAWCAVTVSEGARLPPTGDKQPVSFDDLGCAARRDKRLSGNRAFVGVCVAGPDTGSAKLESATFNLLHTSVCSQISIRCAGLTHLLWRLMCSSICGRLLWT